MNLIELPILYYKDSDKDFEKLEKLGLKSLKDRETKKGVIYINTDHIVTINEDNKGHVSLGLSNETLYIPIKFNKFMEIVTGESINIKEPKLKDIL